MSSTARYTSPLQYVSARSVRQIPTLRLNNANLPSLAQHPKLVVPQYDREKTTVSVVHFGLGNFHRSHQCAYFNALLHIPGNERWGEIAIGMRHVSDPSPEVGKEQDFLFCVTEKPNDEKAFSYVSGNIVDYIAGDLNPAHALDILTDPKIALVTLTVTEGGYFIDPTTGKIDLSNQQIVHDISTNLAEPETVFGMIAAAIRIRRDKGIPPFTVLSCDNMPNNGVVTRSVVVDIAKQIDTDFANWIEETITFPNSMVDRITPAAIHYDQEMLELVYDMDDQWAIVCEPFIQWIIEDNFCGAKPPLDLVGAQFVPDVVPYEDAKLRILNASHIALGCFGGLKSTRYSYETMSEPHVANFIKRYMRDEAIPTIPPVPNMDLEEYADIVAYRFTNNKIADTTIRLLNSTSDRIINFLIPVIEDLLADNKSARLSAFICAAWAQCFVPSTAGVDTHQFYEYRDAELTAAANHNDLSKFLSVRDVFDDLSSNPQFVDDFVRARIDIISIGIDQAITHYVGAGAENNGAKA